MRRNGDQFAPSGAPVVVTGGSGFVGSNVVNRLASMGQRVIVFDNLSRPGVSENLEWLTALHPDLVEVEVGDVRDGSALRNVIRHASHVYHFAAQVAVTTSLEDPVVDFEVNARGTLNVLEAIRAASGNPTLLFTSTNKVYGDLSDVPLVDTTRRYEPEDRSLCRNGIGEDRPVSFHSPYGCSKGAADQYVIDYARCYGLPTVVFRMSCIYGPRQFGTEDQGWVAHFLIRALEEEEIVIYGDGRQVRDVLFVEDLVDAMFAAVHDIDSISGSAFNIGGGPEFSVSLLDVLQKIEQITGKAIQVEFGDWRTGDQRYYVSDTRRFQKATGWAPSVAPEEGIERLWRWLAVERQAITGDSGQQSGGGARRAAAAGARI